MSEIIRARRLLIGLVAACYVSVLILVPVVGLSVDVGSFAPLAGYSLGIFVIVGVLCRWRKIHFLQAAVENVSLGAALTGPLVILAYVAALSDFPLQDHRLIAMDRALGIDWATLIRAVDMRALLAATLTLVYRLFGVQLVLLPVLLSLSGRSARAYQMMAGYGLICILSSIISIWYPAVGTYTAFTVDLHHLRNLSGSLGTEFVPQLLAVRNDPNFVLRLGQASGIISFPSVHAAVAVLCAWAMWTNRLMRWPFLMLNLLMICSAITEGGHYVVDLIAGAGLSGFVIASVLYVTRSYPSLDVWTRNHKKAVDQAEARC
ncbi:MULTISPECIES: phosphatase PAP2 family protein [unclassified Rhizobium]|uniref:phosphatase PAP2 family protein n=1 Tax=unclassified Rhizobium TaxID=2613769 RepID=UPI000EAA378A|nr:MULTISPECIES: phosphatase PAP2 family protein [unclassified Rhizobium]AYG70170.1 PAP2 family protein [Rhizobium sp. CCGE531]AYG76545.1 PAP2 family protein [Rhizobium sp. CCGE532]